MSDTSASDFEYAPAAGTTLVGSEIHTSSTGLLASRVMIPTQDGEIPAYYARPTDATNAPIVLVLSEAFGLHEHIEDVGRRFAHEGFFTLAPDLMYRQSNPSKFDNLLDLVKNLLLQIPDDQVLSDLDASITWAGTQGADEERVSATGFCWGGRRTWLFAAHRKMNAAVAWYGILDNTSNDIFPAHDAKFPFHPIDLVEKMKTPVLGLYGGKDESIPLHSVDEMKRRLKAGVPTARDCEIVVFENAPHAFFADYRESYDSEAATDGWKRCLQWMKDRI